MHRTLDLLLFQSDPFLIFFALMNWIILHLVSKPETGHLSLTHPHMQYSQILTVDLFKGAIVFSYTTLLVSST